MQKLNVTSFADSTVSVIQTVSGITLEAGEVFTKLQPCTGDSVMVMIGVTGQMKGNIIVNMTTDLACRLAATMMMEPEISELDLMAQSAICELCNMMMGSAATALSQNGIIIDITPPTVLTGQNIQYHIEKSEIMSIPFSLESEKVLELNLSYKKQ